LSELENLQGNSLKMPQSEKKGVRSKGKSKVDSFVWTDDEVELLLKITMEQKVSNTSEMSIGNHARQST